MSALAARASAFRLPSLVGFALVGLAGVCLTGGCGTKTTPPPHGSPVLTHVYWLVAGTPGLVWSLDPAQQLQEAVPPLASEVDFVFDRRLDGDRIEDTVTVDGVVSTRPKAVGPVVATWPDMAATMADPPFSLPVSYNSVDHFGAGTSYVFARPPVPGFPANEKITFTLDLTSLTSAYGEPAVEPPLPVVAVTSGFKVTIGVPTTPVTTSFQVPLVFTNRLPGSAAAVSPFIHVTRGGAAVSSKLLFDASDRSRIYVAPADCLGAWPAQTELTVTIDPELTDAFGRPIEAGGAATFSTRAAPASTFDASCPVAEAGAGDAGSDASDAGADAAD